MVVLPNRLTFFSSSGDFFRTFDYYVKSSRPRIGKSRENLRKMLTFQLMYPRFISLLLGDPQLINTAEKSENSFNFLKFRILTPGAVRGFDTHRVVRGGPIWPPLVSAKAIMFWNRICTKIVP